MGCLMHTKYYVMHTVYVPHTAHTAHSTKGTISVPSVHTAVHRQVTQNAFHTNQQRYRNSLFALSFINKYPAAL